MNIIDLNPKKVIEFFSQLCSVPHGSGNTDAISNLVVEFAKQRGLKYIKDEANNVIIFKDGSKGCEDKEPVIIQGHLDMVAVKTDDCTKDMKTEGLDLMTDGEWLWADKTSLGGDDCIAVATAMAILDDDNLKHPPLECVFTTDEETGMDGAAALDCSVLKGRRMLNLDNEEEGVFTVCCAGGARIDTYFKTRRTVAPEDATLVSVEINGLLGGHSGVEIDKGRGNANKLLARLINDFKSSAPLQLVYWCGGTFDNVISKSAVATVYIPNPDLDVFDTYCRETEAVLRSEYPDDNGITVTTKILDKNDTFSRPLSAVATKKIIGALRNVPQGVVKYSRDIPNFVQTSCNLGVIRCDEFGGFRYSISVRSSVQTEKNELIDRIVAIANLIEAEVNIHGDYPGWKYNPVSPIRDRLCEVFEEVTGKKPVCEPLHAGLECGFFATKIEGLDVVALGPTIIDIHSTNEKLNVPSVERLYKVVRRYLETC